MKMSASGKVDMSAFGDVASSLSAPGFGGRDPRAAGSDAGHSTVGDDFFSGHEGRVLAGEKEHHAGDLLGGPQAPADRGVEDDGASPAEQRNSRLEREPGAFRVDAEDFVEIRFAQAREGAPADDPRVQEQDVEPAVLLGDAGEQPPDLGPSPESDATTSAIPRKLARACSSVMGFLPVTITFAPSA